MKDVGSDVVVEYGGSTAKKADSSSKKQNKVSDVIVDKAKDATSESQEDAQTETTSSSTSQPTSSSTNHEASPSETQTTVIACEYPQTGVENDAGFGMTIMSASMLMLLIVLKAVFGKRGRTCG
jgi:hypothetical protein